MQTINTPFAGFGPFSGVTPFQGATNPFVQPFNTPFFNQTTPFQISPFTAGVSPFQNTFNLPISALNPATLAGLANQPFGLGSLTSPFGQLPQTVNQSVNPGAWNILGAPFNNALNNQATIPGPINAPFSPIQGLSNPFMNAFNSFGGFTPNVLNSIAPSLFGAPNVFNSPVAPYGVSPSTIGAPYNTLGTPFNSPMNTIPFAGVGLGGVSPTPFFQNTLTPWTNPAGNAPFVPTPFNQPVWNAFNPIQPGVIPTPFGVQPMNQTQTACQTNTAGKIGEVQQNSIPQQPTGYQPIYGFNPGFVPGGFVPQGYAFQPGIQGQGIPTPFVGYAPINGSTVPQAQREAA